MTRLFDNKEISEAPPRKEVISTNFDGFISDHR